jgi:hypothetical protein
VRRRVIVSAYWVPDTHGRWYRLSEPDWRAAQPGQPVQVAPGRAPALWPGIPPSYGNIE